MSFCKDLLRISTSIIRNPVRTYIHWRYIKPEKAIDYYGFKYLPRFPNEKDPPYEPTKLFLIKRIKKMSGTSHYEKDILRELSIDGHVKANGHINIVKNVPEMNKYLWRIKHLIEITPIRFVNGLPEDGDYRGCYLRDNGDFVMSPKLKIDDKIWDVSEKAITDPSRMDHHTQKVYLKHKWNVGWTHDHF